jgi:hypothetical protein
MKKAALFIPLFLAACGPISVELAEKQCMERARLAAGPRGEIAIGAGSNGPVTAYRLEINSDFLTGRDPSQVFDTCVVSKSGELPRTPLYLQRGWRG